MSVKILVPVDVISAIAGDNTAFLKTISKPSREIHYLSEIIKSCRIDVTPYTISFIVKEEGIPLAE